MAKYSRKKLFGIVAIIFGILVITNPAIIAYIIGLYLIISGLLGLLEK